MLLWLLRRYWRYKWHCIALGIADDSWCCCCWCAAIGAISGIALLLALQMTVGAVLVAAAAIGAISGIALLLALQMTVGVVVVAARCCWRYKWNGIAVVIADYAVSVLLLLAFPPPLSGWSWPATISQKQYHMSLMLWTLGIHIRARILVQVTIYRRPLIGRDGHPDQSEAYDIS